MRDLIKPIVWFTILVVFSISMFTVANWVTEWERAYKAEFGSYPYGALCEVYNSCSK